MSSDRLQEILEKGTEKECLAFFKGMPEKSRREHFPKIKTAWKKVRSNRVLEIAPGKFASNPMLAVTETAYFACATLAEIQQAGRGGRPNDDAVFAILTDRKPDWVESWIETLLDDTYYWAHWSLIRRLIAVGLATRPENPKYYLGMIGSMSMRTQERPLIEALTEKPDLLEHDLWKLFEYDGEGENSLANTDRFQTNWAETFVALMKRGKLPRAKLLQCSLEALERDFNHYRARWFHDFYDRLEPTQKELQQHSARFLGLLRATAPNVATWALAKVEQLAKQGCYETETLCDAIAPILHARAKGTVLQALKLLELQAAAHPQQATAIAATAATALGHEKTDVQNAVIRMLEKLASPQGASVRRVVEKHAPSVSASVRSRVTKWLAQADGSPKLTKAGDQAKTSATSKKSSSKSPNGESSVKTVRKKPAATKTDNSVPEVLQVLLAIDALHQNLESHSLNIPAVRFDGTEIARLTQLQRLDPIENFEELIDVCARVIEDGSLVDDVERCINGMARLCGSKPPDFDRLSGPLLKRVRQLIKKGSSPFFGLDPGNDILGLVYALCTGIAIEPKYVGRRPTYVFEGETDYCYDANMRKPIGFLTLRCLHVAQRIARGTGFQLLSIPTHQQGWIDPRDLAKRIDKWSGPEPDPHDVVLAMLRLAPEYRATALKMLKNTSQEWVQAIRYALGDKKTSIGDTAAFWAAAARARAPFEDDSQVMKKFPQLGPDAGNAAKTELRFKSRKSGGYTFVEASFESTPAPSKSVDPLLVTVMMHACRSVNNDLSFEMGGFGGKTNGAVRWTSMIWPQARESYFAGCAQECLDNLDWGEARWQNRTMLEPLLDRGTPLLHVGTLFLASMLAAKEPGESGLATDIAIRAIEEGRLGSDNFGPVMAELISSGLIKPGRWQKTLAEIARASTLHACVIQLALQQCFASPLDKLPKDSSKLLELLHELSVEFSLPITDPACRANLTAIGSTGKGGKLAKSLLALESSTETNDSVSAALESALQKRSELARQIQMAPN